MRILSWGKGDICLAVYFLLGLTFLRAHIGSLAIYTLFPVWLTLTWIRQFNRMMASPRARAVFLAYPLLIVAIFATNHLSGIPLDRSIFLFKLHTYAFIGWMVFAYYHEMGQADRIRYFVLLGLGVAVFNAGWNYVVEGRYAFASRTLTGGALERQIETGVIDYDLVEAAEAGIASFGRVCSFSLLVPLLVHSARLAMRKYRRILYGMAVILALAVIRASYLLMVVYACIGLYTVFLARQNRVFVKQLWLVSVMMLVILFSLVLIVANPILNALEQMAQDRNNEVYLIKIRDIKGVVTSGDLEALPRIYNYEASWEVARRNLIWGVGYDGRTMLGGHSQILDLVGRSGLVGILPYLIFFGLVNRYFRGMLDRGCPYIRNQRLVIGIPLVFACFTNPMNNYDVWLVYFFYAPALTYLFQERFRPFPDREVLLPGSMPPVMMRSDV